MNESKILQSFALNNEGQLISIRDALRGKACNCACPACGEVLVAKQGEVRAWHFAHESGNECEGGAESALHLAAKQVVVSANHMLAPSLEVIGHYEGPNSRVESASVDLAATILGIDQAELEVPWQTALGRIQPDVVVVSNSEKYFIEIAVTHTVDEHERAKIETLCIAAVEISIDPNQMEGGTWDTLTKEVLLNPGNRRWIYHKRAAELALDAQKAAHENAQHKEHKADTKTHSEVRLILRSTPVRIRQYQWGITLWSGWDLGTNEIIKSVGRRFGARWAPKYKTWRYAPGLFEPLVSYLQELGAVKDGEGYS